MPIVSINKMGVNTIKWIKWWNFPISGTSRYYQPPNSQFSTQLHKCTVSQNTVNTSHLYNVSPRIMSGLGSSVGIETDYGLDSQGSNPGGDEIFPPVQTGSGAHPASCKMGTGSFLGVKCSWGVLLTTHPLLVPQSWKSRAISLPTLWATSCL